MIAIETENLKKSYGNTEVLHGISFTVTQGKLVGFLGPNGAGKTTTIRILLGLIKGSGGHARLFKKNVIAGSNQCRDRIGYLPGDVRFYTHMTGGHILKLFARARKVACDDEIVRLAEKFELPLNKRIRKFSTGMKQKLGLIQSMMHRPQLLILDEPTSALDPLVRKAVFSELRAHVDRGNTVLFSSHTLSEVEELCDEVVILRGGRVIEQERIEVLQDRALRRVTVEFEDDIPSELPEPFQTVQRNGRVLRGTWLAETAELIAWLNTMKIHDATIERPNLEDLFMTYYAETPEK